MSLPTLAAVMAAKLKPANEAINGRPEQEIEYTFYVKLKSLAELNGAKHKEEHEQWQIPLANKDCGVKQRIREINAMRWVLTTKTIIPGQLGQEEIEVDITKEMFARLRQAGENGYKKTRYDFPIFGTDKKWEVDVFMNQQGEPCLWVKVDLEVDGQLDKLPDFPFEIEEAILNQPSQQTAQEANFVKMLWGEEWAQLDI